MEELISVLHPHESGDLEKYKEISVFTGMRQKEAGSFDFAQDDIGCNEGLVSVFVCMK